MSVDKPGNEHVAITIEELALSNPLVLESIFKHCSAKDLSQHRLVCKLWYHVSLPFWKSLSHPIILYENARDAVFERRKPMTLKSFVDNYQKCCENLLVSCWPYQSFKLMFFRNLSVDNAAVKQFWMDCGTWITELQVFGCRLFDYDTYKDVLLCRYTPNVKNFKFSCHFEGFDEGKSSPSNCNKATQVNLKSLSFLYCMPRFGWLELFSHFPNITTFELSSPYRLTDWENELFKMMNSIKTLRIKDVKTVPLTSLTIRIAGSNQSATIDNSLRIGNLLASAKLPLESLNLDAHFFRGEANAHQLDDIFKLYQATLRKLQIQDSLCESHLSNPNVVLSSLKELTLTGKSFRNLSVLKCTPNLALLHIKNPWRSRAMNRYLLKGFIKSSECLKLEYVCNFRYDFDCTPCGMLNLVGWMPNVEILCMPLTNETFRMACKHWTKLKHLEVQNDDVDDDGICGVFPEDKFISGAIKLKEHQLVKLQPNISHLKELRSFVMENHRYSHNDEIEWPISTNDILPTRLTEKSILHGFLKLPCLKKLSITVEVDTVTPTLMDTLKKKIREVNVVQMHHPYRHYRQHP